MRKTALRKRRSGMIGSAARRLDEARRAPRRRRTRRAAPSEIGAVQPCSSPAQLR